MVCVKLGHGGGQSIQRVPLRCGIAATFGSSALCVLCVNGIARDRLSCPIDLRKSMRRTTVQGKAPRQRQATSDKPQRQDDANRKAGQRRQCDHP
ncbi:MAG: hypothetical protein ACKOAM_03170 [Chakrabartia sp.]